MRPIAFELPGIPSHIEPGWMSDRERYVLWEICSTIPPQHGYVTTRHRSIEYICTGKFYASLKASTPQDLMLFALPHLQQKGYSFLTDGLAFQKEIEKVAFSRLQNEYHFTLTLSAFTLPSQVATLGRHLSSRARMLRTKDFHRDTPFQATDFTFSGATFEVGLSRQPPLRRAFPGDRL